MPVLRGPKPPSKGDPPPTLQVFKMICKVQILLQQVVFQEKSLEGVQYIVVIVVEMNSF